MTKTYFKLVEVKPSHLNTSDTFLIVATKSTPAESIGTFTEAKVDWACHIKEGSAAIVNTAGIIKLQQAKALHS